jgi:hypothetical protein
VRSTSVIVSPRSFATTIQRASRKATPSGSASVAYVWLTAGALGVLTSTASTFLSAHIET